MTALWVTGSLTMPARTVTRRFWKLEPTITSVCSTAAAARNTRPWTSPETGTKAQGDEGYEDEQTQLKAAARTKAEEILAQWKSGEATEDSFAQLAMENSADGSKYDGGLYTRVTKGWAVEEFNDWCFDASRKDGDTGIVDTTYGSHVMYFVGYDLPAWAASVTSDLQEKAASEWSTALSENADVQQSDFGMKFVG